MTGGLTPGEALFGGIPGVIDRVDAPLVASHDGKSTIWRPNQARRSWIVTDGRGAMTAKGRRHSNRALVGVVLLIVVLGAGPASARKFCKDGFVTYSSDAPYTDRVAAEAAAVRAWRAARIGLQLPRQRDFPPHDQMNCKPSKDGNYWRCFIRSGRCEAG